jgi:hypothetical protein
MRTGSRSGARAARAAAAVAATALAALLCACGGSGPPIGSHGGWSQFSDTVHGFRIAVQQPYVASVVGREGRYWRVRIVNAERTPALATQSPGDVKSPGTPSASAPASGFGVLEITAWRPRRGELPAPEKLIDVAPRLTMDELGGRLGGRGAQAGPTRIVQPFQPVNVGGTPALEMIYRRDVSPGAATGVGGAVAGSAAAGGDSAGGDAARSTVTITTSVLLVVNDGWALRFAVSGDDDFWRADGPRLRDSLESLQLLTPTAAK